MKFYHISARGLSEEIKEFIPRIPYSAHHVEEDIPRICIARTINECLTGACVDLYRDKWTLIRVYEFEIDENDPYLLTPQDVHDSHSVLDAVDTGEWNYLRNIKPVDCYYMKVRLMDDSRKIKFEFKEECRELMDKFKDVVARTMINSPLIDINGTCDSKQSMVVQHIMNNLASRDYPEFNNYMKTFNAVGLETELQRVEPTKIDINSKKYLVNSYNGSLCLSDEIIPLIDNFGMMPKIRSSEITKIQVVAEVSEGIYSCIGNISNLGAEISMDDICGLIKDEHNKTGKKFKTTNIKRLLGNTLRGIGQEYFEDDVDGDLIVESKNVKGYYELKNDGAKFNTLAHALKYVIGPDDLNQIIIDFINEDSDQYSLVSVMVYLSEYRCERLSIEAYNKLPKSVSNFLSIDTIPIQLIDDYNFSYEYYNMLTAKIDSLDTVKGIEVLENIEFNHIIMKSHCFANPSGVSDELIETIIQIHMRDDIAGKYTFTRLYLLESALGSLSYDRLFKYMDLLVGRKHLSTWIGLSTMRELETSKRIEFINTILRKSRIMGIKYNISELYTIFENSKLEYNEFKGTVLEMEIIREINSIINIHRNDDVEIYDAFNRISIFKNSKFLDILKDTTNAIDSNGRYRIIAMISPDDITQDVLDTDIVKCHSTCLAMSIMKIMPKLFPASVGPYGELLIRLSKKIEEEITARGI